MLPRFLVIGAMKAGTTSVFHCLSEHPQIFLHPRKELSFFVWPTGERTVNRYEAFFARARGDQFCGDVSTQYTKFPRFPEVPKRIAELLPDVKMIYMVRHPVRRALSHYHHLILEGENPGPIDRALREQPDFVAFSRYRLQLAQYEPYFDRSQLLVVVLEEFRQDPQRCLRRMFAHIGCDPDFQSRKTARAANASDNRVVRTPIIDTIQHNRLYRKIQYRLPRSLKQAAVRVLGRRRPQLPTPSPETVLWLSHQLVDDAHQLSQYLQRPQEIWNLGDAG